MQTFTLDTEIRDKDWDPLFVMCVKCFENEPKMDCFHPGGLDPARREAYIKGFKAGTFGGPAERAYAVIREKQSDEIISLISCRVYRGKLGIVDGQFANPPPPMHFPNVKDGEDRKYWEWFWTEMSSKVRGVEELHTPVIVIQVLATDLEWQRHGAASTLLDWISGVAAESNLRVAVQPGTLAIEIGFYEKFGFRVCQKLTLVDKKQFPEREAIYCPMLIKDTVQ